MFVGYVNKNVQQIVYLKKKSDLQLNPKRYLLENNKDNDFKTLCDKQFPIWILM